MWKLLKAKALNVGCRLAVSRSSSTPRRCCTRNSRTTAMSTAISHNPHLVTSNRWVYYHKNTTETETAKSRQATEKIGSQWNLKTAQGQRDDVCNMYFFGKEKILKTSLRWKNDYNLVIVNKPLWWKQITLPPRYQGDPVLLRGCFVLAVPDRCYMAKNGLSYCWCSQKDLCNSAPHRLHSQSSAFYASLLLVTLLLHFKWCNGVC